VDGAAKFPPASTTARRASTSVPADSLHTRRDRELAVASAARASSEGLGQQIRVRHRRRRVAARDRLVLNAHYIGAGKPTKGVARVKLFVARPGTIRAYGQAHLRRDRQRLHRRPARHREDDRRAWEVGGPSAPIVGGPPANDACVLFLSAHMHKRGVRFTTELVDASGARTIYDAGDWEHPGRSRSRAPRLMTRGMQFRYTCTHDNGVTTAPKLGCELEPA
jgi:hypothetical protein